MSEFDENRNYDFDNLPNDNDQIEKQGFDGQNLVQPSVDFQNEQINENGFGSDLKQSSVQELMAESESRRMKRKSISEARKPLAIALLGLIFSLFYGFGIIFSCIAFPMSLKRFRQTKNQNNSWALLVSTIGIALNLVIMIFFGM